MQRYLLVFMHEMNLASIRFIIHLIQILVLWLLYSYVDVFTNLDTAHPPHLLFILLCVPLCMLQQPPTCVNICEHAWVHVICWQAA